MKLVTWRKGSRFQATSVWRRCRFSLTKMDCSAWVVDCLTATFGFWTTAFDCAGPNAPTGKNDYLKHPRSAAPRRSGKNSSRQEIGLLHFDRSVCYSSRIAQLFYLQEIESHPAGAIDGGSFQGSIKSMQPSFSARRHRLFWTNGGDDSLPPPHALWLPLHLFGNSCGSPASHRFIGSRFVPYGLRLFRPFTRFSFHVLQRQWNQPGGGRTKDSTEPGTLELTTHRFEFGPSKHQMGGNYGNSTYWPQSEFSWT